MEELTNDGHTISIGGMSWSPKLDLMELKIPSLHFGQVRRGRVDPDTKIFEGSFPDLDQFVPKNISRRQVCSKFLSVFDILGKLTPVTGKMKLDLREAVKLTEGWDDSIPEELRSEWIKNFWMIERMKGFKFHRAIMPKNATNSKLRLITCVDAATLLVMGTLG